MNRSKSLLGFAALFLIAFTWHAVGGIQAGGGAAVEISAGDSNGDAKVDISDAVHILNFLFAGGPQPAACQSQGSSASGVSFDPAGSTLSARDVQAALFELDQKVQDLSESDSGIVSRLEAIEGQIEMDLVPIPAGTFIMGSPSTEQNRNGDETQHAVTISQAFQMGATEVTQSQFEALMGWNPSAFSGCGACPVDSVNWYDAMEFCKRLTQRHRAEGKIDEAHSYRLPTESEWEYAYRAGTTTRYFFGDVLSCGLGSTDFCPEASPYVWWGGNNSPLSFGPKPVGTKNPNAWGLYDMCGNTMEWCLDAYGPYPQGEVTDPKGPEGGQERILRGGWWGEGLYWGRAGLRYKYPSWDRGTGGAAWGFRVVLVSED
jgi:formylglycine-generating enzyme required for sulfatase activity